MDILFPARSCVAPARWASSKLNFRLLCLKLGEQHIGLSFPFPSVSFNMLTVAAVLGSAQEQVLKDGTYTAFCSFMLLFFLV